MSSVAVNNLTKNEIKTKPIIKFLHSLLRKTHQNINISVAFVEPKIIKKINWQYRHQDRVTDVLAFEDLNEIILCYSRLKKQARQHKHSIKQEMFFLLTHGFLHLLGYDHRVKKDRQKMEEKSNSLLN